MDSGWDMTKFTVIDKARNACFQMQHLIDSFSIIHYLEVNGKTDLKDYY